MSTATLPAARRRSPGRPVAGGDYVRGALLQSARDLFLACGFASVTIRQIASADGSSPAAIHYHFGDKLGLYRAMLDEAVAPVLAALQRLGDPGRGEPADLTDL